MAWNWLVYAAVFSLVPEHGFPNKVSAVEHSPDLVPCEEGWFYFREKCYRAYGDGCSWTVAAGRCEALGGHLVTIESQEEQDFVLSFLLLHIKTHVWIGLQDQEKESMYFWHDGSGVNYTNWKASEPSGVNAEGEDCVEMSFAPEGGAVGTWSDSACTNNNGYICQTNTTERNISPDPTLCPSDNGGGWKFQQSCYHVVKERKPWRNAEEHCRKHYNGGHLVTIQNIVVNFFLNYILSDLGEEPVWIGVSVKDQFQQQWTSGWYVGQYIFTKDVITTFKGFCVVRKEKETWSLFDCSSFFYFVCETSETMPPVLKTPGPDFHCPKGIDDWRDLGGEYCYFMETTRYVSWQDANFECERRGGSLAAIHSKEENDIMDPFIKYFQYGVYIGLLRSVKQGEEFIWSDDSNMDFENWGNNEPSSLDEKCGEINTRSMEWNDVVCERQKGFICSVRKVGPSSSVSNISTDEIEPSSSVTNTGIHQSGPFLSVSNTSIHENTSRTANLETADCSGHIYFKALIGVIICLTLVLILLGIMIYYFRPWDAERRKKSAAEPSSQPSPRGDRPRYRSQTEFVVKDDEKAYECGDTRI